MESSFTKLFLKFFWNFKQAKRQGCHKKKTGFFKILPGKSWKLFNFQGNVLGKSGKKLYIKNSLEIYFMHICLYMFVQVFI